MARSAQPKADRDFVGAPKDFDLASVDYADSFEVETSDGAIGNGTDLARRMFEAQPRPIRTFLVLGWRFGLGLRLGPRPAPDHVLGWKIYEATEERVVLAQSSRSLDCRLVFTVGPSRLGCATLISYRRRAAVLLWTPTAILHRRIVPYLLGKAARAKAGGGRRRVMTRLQRRLVNPLVRPLAPLIPGQIILETTGRRTGLPRRTPLGGRLEGSSLWVVSEFGRSSGYVRNIEALPDVRVRIGRRWHAGKASIQPTDDARERLKRLPRHNSLMVGLLGTDLLSIRIDLVES